MDKKKFGWTEKGIIGFIFTPMGAIFLTLGILLSYFKVGTDPEDPIIFLCVFGGMGAIFLIIGLILLFMDLRRRAALQRCVDGGYVVMAKIMGTRNQNNIRANGVSPYMVECHWKDTDTGETHVFYSRYLYFDPSDMITAEEVPVYLDRMDGKTAYVDIDAVLPRVVMHKP